MLKIATLLTLIATAFCAIAQDSSKKQHPVSPSKIGEFRLSDGSTLNHELDKFLGAEYIPRNKRPPLHILFNNGTIISLKYKWEYTGGPYPNRGPVWHTFDLLNKREVKLWNEIEPTKKRAFEKMLIKKIQPKMDIHRKKYPKKVFEDVFGRGKYPTLGLFNDNFRIKNLFRFETFYILKNEFHYVIVNYWGFPHAGEALDFGCDITIPLNEINQYIKRSSNLKYCVK